jgi:hypothetical protein
VAVAAVFSVYPGFGRRSGASARTEPAGPTGTGGRPALARTASRTCPSTAPSCSLPAAPSSTTRFSTRLHAPCWARVIQSLVHISFVQTNRVVSVRFSRSSSCNSSAWRGGHSTSRPTRGAHETLVRCPAEIRTLVRNSDKCTAQLPRISWAVVGTALAAGRRHVNHKPTSRNGGTSDNHSERPARSRTRDSPGPPRRSRSAHR